MVQVSKEQVEVSEEQAQAQVSEEQGQDSQEHAQGHASKGQAQVSEEQVAALHKKFYEAVAELWHKYQPSFPAYKDVKLVMAHN